MKKRRLVLIFALLVVVVSTAVSFAAQSSTTSITGISASSNTSGITTPTVGTIVNGPTSGNPPDWSPLANATGNITAGDLYIVDMVTAGVSKRLTIYLNNPYNLSQAYSYLNMNIAIYEADNATTPAVWTAVSGASSYLTLSNGYITFDLDNGKKYAVVMTGGSFYTISTATASNLAPSFFAELR